MSDRDKKIMMVLAPLVLLLAFWFLLLSPKRAEVSKLGDNVSAAQAQRDTAVSSAAALEGSRKDYAKDYETVVRLGKAVPSNLNMPSLLVQLDTAAKGTGIDFDSVKAGERSAATAAAAPAASSGSGSTATPSGSSQPPVAAGGDKAQSSAGQSAEKANDASATSDKANQAATQQPPATGSGSSSPSSTAPGATAGAAAGNSGVAGLDSVPLDFAFTGSYFDLADFFHRMKRFVRVANEDIKVQGRLMTIDNLEFTASSFPTISANVKATVYLTPKSEGTTAGATPNGPSTTTTPAGSATPAAASGSTPAPASSSAPTAGAE